MEYFLHNVDDELTLRCDIYKKTQRKLATKGIELSSFYGSWDGLNEIRGRWTSSNVVASIDCQSGMVEMLRSESDAVFPVVALQLAFPVFAKIIEIRFNLL